MTNKLDHPDISPVIHPPVLVLIFLAIAYVLGRFVPLPLVFPSILRNAGLFIAFVGFLLGIGAFIEFRRARTTLNPHGSVRQLVTSGIYRFTRNPIYLGFLLMVIGIPLAVGWYWGFLLAPFFILAMDRLIIEREESYLEKKFGKAYTSYTSQVRRWL